MSNEPLYPPAEILLWVAHHDRMRIHSAGKHPREFVTTRLTVKPPGLNLFFTEINTAQHSPCVFASFSVLSASRKKRGRDKKLHSDNSARTFWWQQHRLSPPLTHFTGIWVKTNQLTSAFAPGWRCVALWPTLNCSLPPGSPSLLILLHKLKIFSKVCN